MQDEKSNPSELWAAGSVPDAAFGALEKLVLCGNRGYRNTYVTSRVVERDPRNGQAHTSSDIKAMDWVVLNIQVGDETVSEQLAENDEVIRLSNTSI